MNIVATYNPSIHTLASNRLDPTRTTTLRNAFAADFRRRFNRLTRQIRQVVDKEDAFGLRIATNAAGQVFFGFPRSADKITAFMNWFNSQVDKGILQVGYMNQVGAGIESAWTNMYITDSYKRGVIRARYELQKAGFPVPSIEQTGGINISMGTPFHLDRLGILYTRTYAELKGITSSMDSQISRILAQGIADGDNPRLLASKLIATINGTGMGDLAITDTLGRYIPAARRAEMLARTEIIRAHHQATIQEYRNWGAEGVVVQAEWMTAGDNRVCNQCANLQGSVFTLDVIENMIPLHPMCRCMALPFKEAEVTKVDLNEQIIE